MLAYIITLSVVGACEYFQETGAKSCMDTTRPEGGIFLSDARSCLSAARNFDASIQDVTELLEGSDLPSGCFLTRRGTTYEAILNRRGIGVSPITPTAFCAEKTRICLCATKSCVDSSSDAETNSSLSPAPVSNDTKVEVMGLAGVVSAPLIGLSAVVSLAVPSAVGGAGGVFVIAFGGRCDAERRLEPPGLHLARSVGVEEVFGSYAVAALVGSIAVLLLAACPALLCMWVVRCKQSLGKGKTPTSLQLQGMLRFPAYLVVLLVVLHPGLAFASVQMLFHGDTNEESVLGGVALAICIALPAWLAWIAMTRIPKLATYRADVEAPKTCFPPTMQLSMIGPGCWVSTDPQNPFAVRFASMLHPYKQDFCWGLATEFVLITVTAVLASPQPSSWAMCGHMRGLTAVLFFTALGVKWHLKVYAKYRDQILDTVRLAAGGVGMLCMAIGFYGQETGSIFFVFGAICLVVIVLAILIQMVLDVVTYFTTRGRAERIQEAEDDDTSDEELMQEDIETKSTKSSKSSHSDNNTTDAIHLPSSSISMESESQARYVSLRENSVEMPSPRSKLGSPPSPPLSPNKADRGSKGDMPLLSKQLPWRTPTPTQPRKPRNSPLPSEAGSSHMERPGVVPTRGSLRSLRPPVRSGASPAPSVAMSTTSGGGFTTAHPVGSGSNHGSFSGGGGGGGGGVAHQTQTAAVRRAVKEDGLLLVQCKATTQQRNGSKSPLLPAEFSQDMV